MMWVTTAVNLLDCQKSVWLDAKLNLEWLRHPRSEAQALGTVSHALVESIDTGKFDEVPSEQLAGAIEGEWNDLVAREFATLSSKSYFGSPAKPQRWPFFIQKQAAVIDRALRRRTARGNIAENQRPKLEEWLVSSELDLGGRVDRIEFVRDKIRIVDLKTGGHNSAPITTRFKYQLFLYAALYRQIHSVSPFEVAIEWQDQSRTSLSITDQQIDAVLNLLEQARRDLISDQEPDAIATEEKCRYCNYRSICESYVRADRSAWIGHPGMITGTVTSKSENLNGTVLAIEPSSSHPTYSGTVIVKRLNNMFEIVDGDFVTIDRLKYQTGTNNFDIAWNSRITVRK